MTTSFADASRSFRHVRGWPVLDLVLGLGLAIAAAVDTLGSASIPGLAAIPAVVAGGAVALRTRAPFASVLLAAGGFAAYGAMPSTSTPLWSFLTVLVVTFSAGSRLSGRRLWLAAAIVLAAGYVVQLLDAHRTPDELGWGEVYLTPLIIVLGPGFAGWLLQQARGQAAELRRLARELEEERQQHVVAAAEAERGRIARELHDVISHSVSVMVVQAGAAEQVLPEGSPARARVRAVRETGKEALAELRRQLGVLGRASDDAAPLPGLDDLPRLARATGASLSCEGIAPSELAPGLGLAAYRVVQEALTNASRHAGGGAVRVRLVHHADAIEVDVVNAAGAPSGEKGSGRGLIGMRERVELYGGLLDAGERDGGWRVHAWLPLTAGSPT